MYRFLLLLILLSGLNASELEEEIIIFFRPEWYFFLQGKSEIVSFKIKRTTNNKQQLWWSCQISNSGEFVFTLFFWGWSSIGYPPPLPHSIFSGFKSLVPNYILVGGHWYGESEMSCPRNQKNDLARSRMWTSWLGVHHADRQFSWSLFFHTVSINGSKPGINNHVYNVIVWRKVVLTGIDISKSD